MNLKKNASRFLDRLREKGIALYRKYSLPRGLVFAVDIIIVFTTFFFSYILRFNFAIQSVDLFKFTNQAITALSAYALSMIVFKPYSGLIRHTTINDISRLLKANTFALISLLLISGLGRIYNWNQAFVIPLSIIIIHYVLVTVITSIVRVSIKILFESVNASKSGKKNVLIFGAGILGVAVKRIIESDHFSIYRIVGFLDDDRKLRGKTVNQHPIWSTGVLDKKFVRNENIKTIILAVNRFPQERKALIIKKALSIDLEVLEVPSADNWLQGKLSMNQIQRVKPEDLLGRDPIKMNTERIFEGLDRKTVMVTGAAGSIGSELVRQIANFRTVRLILIDQAETPSFFIKAELEKEYKDVNIKMLIADVTNKDLMERIFSIYRPDIVFHAAAYKHVPIMEENPHEAVRVNLGGTRIITDLSIKYGVKKFIMISSDKAVNPTNVMGASKRLCELYVHSVCKDDKCLTSFVTTRFGNVLGSNGSVIPIFKKQIESGGPVTVTHPGIKRYFMTIPEACQLVLEAAFMGNGGEIFVFDMGDQISIYTLAEQMIKLAGLTPGQDIKIEITGLRPGEKLYEELLSDKEKTIETYHPKIMIAQNGKKWDGDLVKKVDELLNNLYQKSAKDIVMRIKELVPEYKSEDERKLQNAET